MKFPQKGIYRRKANRIYFSTDFKDGEEIKFSHFGIRPHTKAEGLAFYESVEGYTVNLINLKDIEAIEY